jgi:hypothetical protein
MPLGYSVLLKMFYIEPFREIFRNLAYEKSKMSYAEQISKKIFLEKLLFIKRKKVVINYRQN